MQDIFPHTMSSVDEITRNFATASLGAHSNTATRGNTPVLLPTSAAYIPLPAVPSKVPADLCAAFNTMDKNTRKTADALKIQPREFPVLSRRQRQHYLNGFQF